MNKIESKKNESNVQKVNIVIPPDGGCVAWLIVVASFMSNFTVDGICFSFGKQMTEMSKKLDLPASTLASIGSAQLGLYYLIGPLACALINHYGFRKVAILGSIISFMGILAASFTTSHIGILILYGVFGGIGFGMINTPALLIVGYYFEKYRALTSGIAVCGSSIGGLCLSILFAKLIDKYSWDITMRIQSGFMLICFICALVYRPVKPTKVPLAKDRINEVDVTSDEFLQLYQTNSMVSIDLEERSEESRHFPQISIISSRFLPIYQEGRETKEERCSCWTMLTTCWKNDDGLEKLAKENVISVGPLDRKDIFYSGSVMNLSQYQMMTRNESFIKTQTTLSYHLSMIHDAKNLLSTDIPANSTNDATRCFGISHMIQNALKLLFDISLLKSTVFLIISIGCLLYALAWFVPYMFLQKRGETNNIPNEYINWFVGYISIGNAIGRLSAGILATILPSLNPCYMIGTTTIFAGIFTVISASVLTTNVYMQVSYCILFGFSIAFLNALRSVMFVYLLGIDKLTNAFGLSSIMIGVGALSGTPIASAIFEASGSFVLPFVVTGILFMASGLFIILASLVFSEKERNKIVRN